MSTPSYETIRYELSEQIATITLHRPQQMNAFTPTMMRELIEAFDRADADDTVRAVIVTGEGRAFSAGADLSGGTAGFFTDGADGGPVRADGSFDYSHPAARDGGGRVTLRIFECLKPVIAAINGVAAGIGATMTLPMDARLCSDSARFGFVFARRGIVPEAASAFFLPRIVGISQALQWCYSGRVFDAAEALSGRLVQSVHAPADLLPAARALARQLVEHSAPVSVAVTRQMLWRGLSMAHPMEAHRVDSRMIVSRGRSADAQEGVGAFLEKRAARFPDRVSADMPECFPWWDPVEYR